MTQPKPARSPVTKEYFNPCLYARVSTDDQDTALQLREVQAWCQYQRLPKPAEYIDHGWSGAKNSRPDFDRLMATALRGGHDLVVVWKLDRFGRSTRHLLESIERLTQAGVRFVSITDGIDTDKNTAIGKLMLTLLAAFAEFERNTTMERSTAGRDVRFAAGQPDSWNLAYGFEKGQPKIKEPNADIIRHLFQWRDEEYSVYEIEERVTKLAKTLGLKPPRGKRWYAKTMLGWLRNRQYVCEYSRCGHLFELPRMIDQDLFERVNRKMGELYAKGVGNPKNKYLLTGILESWCGQSMSGLCDHALAYYRCSASYRRSKVVEFHRCPCEYLRCDRVDDVVWGEVWRLLKDPVRLRRMVEAYARREEGNKPAAGRDVREKLAAAKDREQRIKDNFEDGDITREEKIQKLAAVRQEMLLLEAEVRAMGKIIEIPSRPLVEATLEAITQGGEPEGYEDRRHVLDGLVDLAARLVGDEVEITGKVPIGQAGQGSGNGENRLTGLHHSYEPMPFILKAKLAA